MQASPPSSTRRCDTIYDDVTLRMMMWHYVWWCDTKYDDVTLCMMMWHYVWWCDTGKSSLINAILGSRFCQEGVVPTTTTINMLRYGDGADSGQIQRNKVCVGLFWHLCRSFMAMARTVGKSNGTRCVPCMFSIACVGLFWHLCRSFMTLVHTAGLRRALP